MPVRQCPVKFHLPLERLAKGFRQPLQLVCALSPGRPIVQKALPPSFRKGSAQGRRWNGFQCILPEGIYEPARPNTGG